MSDTPVTPDAPLPTPSLGTTPTIENVGRGMLFAAAAFVGGIVLTVVLFEAGFLAALSGLAIAAGAVFLYDKGAGTAPRRGLVPLVTLIVVSLVVAIAVAIVVDVWRAYDGLPPQVQAALSRGDFVREELNHYVWDDYGKDIALYFVFAALGVFGTFRRLLAAPR